jgi:hypothetical protein
MRKLVFPRILGLFALYGAVFVALVILQFTKQGNFTQRIGAAVVSGQYQILEEGGARLNPNEYPITGGAGVFFGGLEFQMKTGEGKNDFVLIDKKGDRREAVPELMAVSEDAAHFRMPGGTELAFTTQYAGGKPELRISGTFAEDISGADIPYRLLRSSRIRESGDGHFVIVSDGVSYTFNRSAEERELLSLKAEGPSILYWAIPEKKAFAPENFILPQAFTQTAYNESVTRWRDRNFSLWNRIIAGQNDEDMVIAYGGDAVRRGTYKAAVSAVSPAFLTGDKRTFVSSVYLGGMEQALRSFTNGEREKISRLSRQLNEKSLDFLRENHVFEFFSVRGYVNFIEDGTALIHAIDPASLSLEVTPGVFEGYMDLKQFRPHEDNPFERLIDQACFVISEGILRFKEINRAPENAGDSASTPGDWILVFRNSAADMEFNLRLGKALWAWAETSGNRDWAALGRSLVLSVLSLADGAGTAPAALLVSGDGRVTEDARPRISSARLYRILNPGEYYPRAAGIGSGVNGIWTWTAASSVTAAQENNVLDISVSFPSGETHYMMIRGVRPFTKIQLYNIDYRTDPQFERYDSSGWIYSAPDQILILKMKHRTAVEHIRIFY